VLVGVGPLALIDLGGVDFGGSTTVGSCGASFALGVSAGAGPLFPLVCWWAPWLAWSTAY